MILMLVFFAKTKEAVAHDAVRRRDASPRRADIFGEGLVLRRSHLWTDDGVSGAKDKDGERKRNIEAI